MSMELYVLFERSKLPSREAWQRAIDGLGFDLKLGDEGELETSTGYWPMVLEGVASGVEVMLEDGTVAAGFPEHSKMLRGLDAAASFRWGGDEREMACGMIAAAGLASVTDGVWLDPEESECLVAAGAVARARAAAAQAAAGARGGEAAIVPTPGGGSQEPTTCRNNQSRQAGQSRQGAQPEDSLMGRLRRLFRR